MTTPPTTAASTAAPTPTTGPAGTSRATDAGNRETLLRGWLTSHDSSRGATVAGQHGITAVFGLEEAPDLISEHFLPTLVELLHTAATDIAEVVGPIGARTRVHRTPGDGNWPEGLIIELKLDNGIRLSTGELTQRSVFDWELVGVDAAVAGLVAIIGQAEYLARSWAASIGEAVAGAYLTGLRHQGPPDDSR